MLSIPALPTDGEPTRATLHAYAHAVAALPRAHALAHPSWWHISLKVRPDGLVTDAMPLPAGGSAFIRMDPRTHLVMFETSTGESRAFPMNADLTGTQMGSALIAAGAEFGLAGAYDRARFENDDPRPYNEANALALFQAFVAADAVFTAHRNRIGGMVGPIQLWPHGFDLAFEWFGTRSVVPKDDGASVEQPAQLNLGFYPAGDAYFYSNPWPFEADLQEVPLPGGAQWHTDGWDGSILAYTDVADRTDGADQVLAYAKAVYEAAAPRLTE